MFKATDLSVSDNSIIITLRNKRVLKIPLGSIKGIKVASPCFLSTKGIVWHELHLFLRNIGILSIASTVCSVFLLNISQEYFWMLLYACIFIAVVVIILNGKRYSQEVILETNEGDYFFKVNQEEHWQFLYHEFQSFIPANFSKGEIVLETLAPEKILYPVLAASAQLCFLIWTLDYFDLNQCLLFGLFSLISSFLFFQLVLIQGKTIVQVDQKNFTFLDNRGKYKNIKHTIEFGMIEKLSFNKNHQVIIQRCSHKDLSTQTGLENFSHFNRIDYHFFRKGYVINKLNKPMNGFQLAEFNDWIKSGTVNGI